MNDRREELRLRVTTVLGSLRGSDTGSGSDGSGTLIGDLWKYIEEIHSEPIPGGGGADPVKISNPDNAVPEMDFLEGALNSLDTAILSLKHPSLSPLYVSSSLATVIGDSVDGISKDPKAIMNSCHPDDLKKVTGFFRNLTATEKSDIEFRILTPAGEERWVHIDAKQIAGHTGRVLRHDLVIRNNTKQRQFQNFSSRLNNVLLTLGPDFEYNIDRLTSLLGELFGATCALYNRLQDGMLCSVGQWLTPPDYNPVDKPDGHICYDVIRNSQDKFMLVRHLPDTVYAATDPNVKPYSLETYIGKAVFCEGEAVGSICAVFQSDFEPGIEHENLIDMIANAIGIEENRRKATQALKETDEKLQALINSTPDIICFKGSDGRWLQANDSILKLYCLTDVDYQGKTEPELADFTADIYKDAFRNCGSSDELAWQAGKLSRTEETIPDIHGVEHIFDVIKVPIYNDDSSRKGLVVFGRDITPRIKAERQTMFLNQSALEFIQLEDTDNIYEFIGNKVHELAGKSIVMVTSFDETTQVATLQALNGIGKSLDVVLKLLKQHPVGMSAVLTPERKQEVLYQKLTGRHDLFELLSGAVNKTICKALENLFDIGKIYEMGFARRDFLLGDVTIITPQNNELLNKEVIEAFIKLAAVALHRRQVKEALRESDESYRQLFNSITSAVYMQDRQGRFLDVNEGAVRMYGYPREQFIGRTPEFLAAPGKNDDIDIEQVLKKTFEGIPQQIEFWGKRSNGEIFPKDVRFYKGKYFGNDVAIVIANDITGQYAMISQLVVAKEVAETNLQKIKSIVSAFPDSIYIIDQNGILHEHFSADSEPGQDQQDELYERFIGEVMKEEIVELTLQNIREVLHSGQMRKYEYSTGDNGQIRYYEARMVKLTDDRVLAVIRNTTERMELMQALFLSKEKAEESDRLKTAFLHNISHEIRTPMNGIVGFSNLLTQPGISPESVREYNTIINSCSNQLLSIISDIVSIATLEAGQEKVREAPANLNELMHMVYFQLMSKASEKNLNLSYSAGLDNNRANVLVDETKLNQVLTNLLNNAIKFTEKGEIRFRYELNDQLLTFCVEDSGIGIPEHMQEAVFERFRQVDTETSSNFGGTGLGLSISKSYIELMGGRIWLESSGTNGTRFYFTLPFKPVPALKMPGLIPAESPSGKGFSGKSVLIADDEYFNYRLLDRMLQSSGLTLQWVENGKDAVDACRMNPQIDLVLMDLKMPEMDGFEATRLIKMFRPDIVIIAQSALALSGDREKAIEAGCDDYVSKPVKKDLLLAKLAQYLS